MSLLQGWTAASGGEHQGLQNSTGTGLADRHHTEQHGATITASNAWIGGVFGVAGLHYQGALRAQRRNGLNLGMTPPTVAPAIAVKMRPPDMVWRKSM